MPYKDKIKAKEYHKKWREKNKDKIMSYNKKYFNEEYHQEYRENNKEHDKEYQKEYSQKNKDKIKCRKSTYYTKNRDNINQRQKDYYQDNKEKRNNYLKNRRINNPIFRLNSNLSTSIGNSLKSQGLRKNYRHWEGLVGYTVKELKTHLENLFLPGMSWDNRREWHIDHIIPKTFFQFTSTDDVEFRYCWSLDNLQPLWAKDNLSKNNRVKYLK